MAKKRRNRNRAKRPWNRPKPPPKRPTLSVPPPGPAEDWQALSVVLGAPLTPSTRAEHVVVRVAPDRSHVVVVATLEGDEHGRRVRVALGRREPDGRLVAVPIGPRADEGDAEPVQLMPDAAELGRDGGRRGYGWRTA